MFNNKILEKIYNDYINKKPKFKSNYKFSFLQKAGLFVPVFNLYSIFKIRKNLYTEIKRAQKELKKEIPFDLNANPIFSDGLNLKLNAILHSIFVLGLLIMLKSLSLGIVITAIGALFIFALAIFINSFKATDEKIEKVVSKLKGDIPDNLSKEDMITISKKIDSQILEDFLVKNNFNITYDNLLKIDKEIQKKESLKNETINREKAKEILLSLSSEVSNEQAIKEEELKYV